MILIVQFQKNDVIMSYCKLLHLKISIWNTSYYHNDSSFVTFNFISQIEQGVLCY